VVVFAGQGDARRSIPLLWRADSSAESTADVRATPGPRPGLSVDAIVDAAIALADEHGMAALSMRAVGERLGCTAMALYTYVPGKGELVDLMYDRVMAELATGHDPAAGWRPALRSWAGQVWEFHLRHPWTLQVSQARPVLGPNEYGVLETLAGILRGTGLPPRVLRGIVGVLVNFVRGAAQTIADARQATAATGMSDQEWWSARAALLEQVAPGLAQRFPMAAWLHSDAAPAPEDATTPYLERDARRNFDTGLAVLLDGIEAAMTGAAR